MDWPILPDEADEIPNELALRVGKWMLVSGVLQVKMWRALREGGKHSQDYLDVAGVAEDAASTQWKVYADTLEVLNV